MSDFYKKLLGITGSIFSLNKGSKEVRELTVDPSAGAGIAAPVGSIGMRNNGGIGEHWLKIGSADTAWVNMLAPEYNYVEDNTLTLITGGWTNKVSLNPTLLGGNYLISWSYQWNYDSAANDIGVRVQINNSIASIPLYIREEPKDSAGTGEVTPAPDTSSTGTDQRYNNSGFVRWNFTAGSHLIDLDFSSLGGNNASLWNVRLELKRVL